MARVPVATINDHPTLRETYLAMQEIKKTAKERQAFLQKQMDNHRDQVIASCKPHWDTIQNTLRDMGRLPSWFKDDTTGLHIQSTDGGNFAIIQVDDGKDESGLPPELKHLLGSLLKN